MSMGVGDIIIDTACRVGQWDKELLSRRCGFTGRWC